MTGRICDRRVFERLSSCGRLVRRGPLIVRYVPLQADQDGPLLAFTIGRRFGPAVVRNRARRRVREAFRLAAAASSSPFPVAMLVSARPTVLERPFARLVEDARDVLAAVSPSPS